MHFDSRYGIYLSWISGITHGKAYTSDRNICKCYWMTINCDRKINLERNCLDEINAIIDTNPQTKSVVAPSIVMPTQDTPPLLLIPNLCHYLMIYCATRSQGRECGTLRRLAVKARHLSVSSQLFHFVLVMDYSIAIIGLVNGLPTLRTDRTNVGF